MREPPSARKDLAWVAALVALYAWLHLPGLGHPASLVNDEVYYVPAARAWLTPGTLDPNPSHPPLGKLLIAAGMAVLGDHPVGWRAPAALFGLLTVLGTYAFGLRLYRCRVTAGLAGALVALDFLALVESRMATLDPFVAFFLLAALLCGWMALEEARPGRWLALAGVFLGLATATKLSGLSGLPVLLAFALLRPSERAAWGARAAVSAAGGIALVFLLAHLPLLARGAPAFWMLYSGNLQHHYTGEFSHPQLASMLEWVTLQQPFWFWWTNDPQRQVITAVVGWGNFLFWWAFWPVLALRLASRQAADRAVALSYLGLWLFWLSSFQVTGGTVHLKGGFFYYMLPCVPFMALAVGREAALAFRWTAGRLGAFTYLLILLYYEASFWPILVAEPVSYGQMDVLVALTGGVERAHWQPWPMVVTGLATVLLLLWRAEAARRR